LQTSREQISIRDMSLVINLKISMSNTHALQFAAVYRGSSFRRFPLGRNVAGSQSHQWRDTVARIRALPFRKAPNRVVCGRQPLLRDTVLNRVVASGIFKEILKRSRRFRV
jgi:hypothetical protein